MLAEDLFDQEANDDEVWGSIYFLTLKNKGPKILATNLFAHFIWKIQFVFDIQSDDSHNEREAEVGENGEQNEAQVNLHLFD